MSIRNLDFLLQPRSVAVVGASVKPQTVGGTVMRNLLAGRFKGPFFPVNPKYDEVAGVKALQDIKAWHSHEGTMESVIRRFILDIINSRNDLTLATLRPDGFPQANTVSYASDGLTLYFGTGRDSQKARNLKYCRNVSLTIDVPYADWNDIRGLSMGAVAEVLRNDSAESVHAMDVLTRKYPAVWDMPPPEPGSIVFVKIVPRVMSVLDYRKGFGHTDLVEVQAQDLEGQLG